MSEFQEGIYFGLPEAEYHAIPALSCSGMKKLAVSPLNYWHHNLNPDREPADETPAQRFGKAVHCRVLEPEGFGERYAVKLTPEDYPGCLVTSDDLKEWLSEHSLPTSGKRKQDLIDRIVGSGTFFPTIWDQECERIAELTVGKVVLGREESLDVEKVAAAVAADPFAAAVFSSGMPEVTFVVRDSETGVLLKARMDYVRPAFTADLKTFSNSRGKPTDRAVFDAIYYEGYYLQAAFYPKVRELARRKLVAGEIRAYGEVGEQWLKGFADRSALDFVFVFVESAEPHEVRVVKLRRAEAPDADANVYWLDAERVIAESIRLYDDCMQQYGAAPWREPREPHVLEDGDIPQLLFAGRY